MSLQFRLEKIWTRLPLVTAKTSGELDGKEVTGAGGKDMCVTGLECGEGSSCWDRKPRQKRWSGVTGEGPEGSFKGCNAVTGAAMAR